MTTAAREAIEARLALMRYRIEHGWPRKPIAQIVEEGKA